MKAPSFKTLPILLLIAAAGFYAPERTQAQTTYFQDFSNSAIGATTFSDGSQFFSTSSTANVGVTGSSKELQFTEPSTGYISAFILPVLDSNVAISAFSVKWNAVISGNFPNAADGFSFNFGPFVASTNLIGFNLAQEGGYTNGLSFAVQTYQANSPGFYIRSHGTTLASSSYTSATQWGVNNSQHHYFEVDWNAANGMTVQVDHQVIFSNVAITGFTPQVGDRFVWAARSGGLSETLRLDNFTVVTRGNFRKLSVTSPSFHDAKMDSSSSPFSLFSGLGTFYWTRTNNGYAGASLSPAKAVRAYAITTDSQSAPANAANRPTQWVLQGSNNGGSTWGGSSPTVSCALTNYSETWVGLTTDTNAYSATRLNVLANGGGTDLLVDELDLYEIASAPPAITTISDIGQGNFGFFDVLYHPQPMSYTFTISPEGSATSVTFDWGTNSSYGHTFTTNVAAGILPVTLAATLGRLQGDRDYHYRITAQNAAGTVQTSDQIFHLPSYIPADLADIGRSYPSPTLPAPTKPMDSAIVAADLDRDGKMDILLNGGSRTITHDDWLGDNLAALVNNFTDEPTRPGLRHTHLAVNGDVGGTVNSWGCLVVDDFNNDGRLDFYESGTDAAATVLGNGGHASDYLFLGYDPVPATNIFYDPPLADRTNGFMYPFFMHFNGGSGVKAAVADFNGDGRKDILVANGGDNMPYTLGTQLPPFLYFQNEWAASPDTTKGRTPLNFASAQELPGLFQPPADANVSYINQRAIEGDYDNDGNMDVLMCPGGLYHNDGFGNFTHVTNAFSGVTATWGAADESAIRSAVWGDLNNDGLLDVIISYFCDKSYLYLNLGNGSFTNTGVIFDTMTGYSANSYAYDYAPIIALADMDHDGQLDVYDRYAITNLYFGAIQIADVIHYNHNGVFTPEYVPTAILGRVTDLRHVGLANTGPEAVTLADFNNDGRLDFAECGGYNLDQESHPETWITFNLKGTSNQPPTAPMGLSSSTGPGTVTLNWGYGTDEITPSNSLTYNLRIGTAPGADDVMGSLAREDGVRLVARPGNKWLAHTTTMHLPPGTYYWSVQSIDQGFLGSPFAPAQSFTVTGDTAPHFCDTLKASGNTTNVNLSMTVWTGYENALGTLEYGLTTNYDHVVSQMFSTNETFQMPGNGTNTYTSANIMSVHSLAMSAPITTDWNNYHWRLTISNSFGSIVMLDTGAKWIVPKLMATPDSGNQLKLQWQEAPGYQLEYKTSLTDAVWQTNSTTAVLSGEYRTLSLPRTGATKFFRLHNP